MRFEPTRGATFPWNDHIPEDQPGRHDVPYLPPLSAVDRVLGEGGGVRRAFLASSDEPSIPGASSKGTAICELGDDRRHGRALLRPSGDSHRAVRPEAKRPRARRWSGGRGIRSRLTDVVGFCLDRNTTNVFLVEGTDLSETGWGKQIQALADLRLTHRLGNFSVPWGAN
jgi:hypothetical protein